MISLLIKFIELKHYELVNTNTLYYYYYYYYIYSKIESSRTF